MEQQAQRAQQVARKSVMAVELGTEARPELIRWSTTWGPEARYSPFDSYALRTVDGWVLIDPEAPSADVMERLRQLIGQKPVATVLTSDGHERACYQVRDRWGTPVWAPAPGSGQTGRPYALEGQPDHSYEEGTRLPGGLRAFRLDALWDADHALLWPAPSGVRVLFTGDAVNGQVETALARGDHYRREPGLAFGSRPRYVERHPNPEAFTRSLRRLLDEGFDLICGAHGRPYRDDAQNALRRLLDSV